MFKVAEEAKSNQIAENEGEGDIGNFLQSFSVKSHVLRSLKNAEEINFVNLL